MGKDSAETGHGSQEQLVIDMDLESLLSKPASWPERCIYRVPRLLREVNENAYTPLVVSIGPIHHDKEDLKITREDKLRYLAEFCRRTRKKCAEVWKQVEDCEESTRRCYEQTFDNMSRDKFIEMVLLDSVFIIEFLLRVRGSHIAEDLLPPGEQPWLICMITRDLVLLENQLPFFVVQNLYNFAFGGSHDKRTFYSLAGTFCFSASLCSAKFEDQAREGNRNCSCNCFACLYCFWLSRCLSRETSMNHYRAESNDESKKKRQEVADFVKNFEKQEHKHFVDLIRTFHCHNHPKRQHGRSIGNLPSASKLQQAGVEFKLDPEALPLDIKFDKGQLKMPGIHFHGDTECLYRNLIAFEQCHYPEEAYISDFTVLLNFLIDTESDADVLVQSGVIIDWSTERKVLADRINMLSRGITDTGSCYHEICLKLNAHYDNFWYRTIATLRSVYFSNLWRGSGTIAALILLFLTVMQSIRNISRMF